MTQAKSRIIELFRTLPPTDQRALMRQLAETAQRRSYYDQLSPAELARLDEGIAQAESGDTILATEIFDEIATRGSI